MLGPDKHPADVVDDLLDTVPPKTGRSSVRDNPDLAKAIERFLHLKAAGDERAHVSLTWFYENKLRTLYDGPMSADTVKKFVRKHLQRDFRTGKPL